MLIQRYGGAVESSIRALENDPTSTPRKEAVAAELRHAGASRDSEIARLAGQLMQLIETGRIDPVERGRRRAGVYAISEVLGQHVNAVYRIRSSYPGANSLIITVFGVDGPATAASMLSNLSIGQR